MTPAKDAHAVLRLLDRERRLNAQLADTRARLRDHGRRLSDAAGYRVILTGPALARLAAEQAA